MLNKLFEEFGFNWCLNIFQMYQTEFKKLGNVLFCRSDSFSGEWEFSREVQKTQKEQEGESWTIGNKKTEPLI